MKQILLVLFLFTGFASFGQIDIWGKIQGNGNLQKETRKTGTYTAISVAGSMHVEVIYGNSNSIEVEADENLLPYIITEVKGNELVIKTKNFTSINSRHKMTVYATVTRVNSLHLSGSGSITGEGNFSNDGKTDIRISGSGHVRMSFSQAGSLYVAISGSGNIKLDGSASTVDASISGSGNADCTGVVCTDASARISGSGNVRIFANRSINASLTGSGNVYYSGPATDVRQRTSGSGKIIKLA